MSTLPRYRQDIADNPVQRHEREHLRREGTSRFAYGLYAITLFALLAPIIWGFDVYFQAVLNVAFSGLILLNIVMIFGVEMRMMNDSAESIRREFQGRTWTLLILTGVDTWRLILGKWLGVIRGHRRDIVMLYLLRLVTFIWGMGYYSLNQGGFRVDYLDGTSVARLWDMHFDVSAIVVVALILAIYLALEMMLVAALPLPLSLLRTARKGATWAALGLRILIPVVFALALAFIFGELPYALRLVERYELVYPDSVNTALFSLGMVLMDNGFLMSAFHIDHYATTTNFSRSDAPLWTIFVVVQFLGIGLYLLWIWGALRMAKFLALVNNVSAPGFEPKIKPKHPDHYKMQAMPSTETAKPIPVRTVPKVRIYRCEVVRYDRDFAQLSLAVYAQGETTPLQTIRFTGVSYFTGMLRWRTTDVTVEKRANLESFANQHHIDYDRLSGDAKLYELQSMESPVYVIATGVQHD